jgi:hypothetical protein
MLIEFTLTSTSNEYPSDIDFEIPFMFTDSLSDLLSVLDFDPDIKTIFSVFVLDS